MKLNLDQDQKESFVLFCLIVLLFAAMILVDIYFIISGEATALNVLFLIVVCPALALFSFLVWKIWLFARRKTYDLPPPQPPVKKGNPKVVELAMKRRKPADLVDKRKAACTA